MGVGLVVEQHHHREPLGPRVEPVRAKAAQRAGMAGERHAGDLFVRQPVAIGGARAIGKARRFGEAAIEALRVVAGGVDPGLIGQHVVERGRDPGISDPENAVVGGEKARGVAALVAHDAILRLPRIRGQHRRGHPGRPPDVAAVEVGQSLPVSLSMISETMR